MTQVPCYLSTLNGLPGVRADFIGRISGVPVGRDRVAMIERLRPAHGAAVEGLGFKWSQFHRAEQVHGVDIAVVGRGDRAGIWPGVDGLITGDAEVLLGICVADCGAVYIVDPVKEVQALLHSGKKGTEGNIVGRAIGVMQKEFGCRAGDMMVALAPCIRPPMYEVGFAAEIGRQVIDAGVPEGQFIDSGECTGMNLKDYYSYRVERGATGRMLALLGREG